MSIQEVWYDRAYEKAKFASRGRTVGGLDIWIPRGFGQLPTVRDRQIRPSELDAWLHEEYPFDVRKDINLDVAGRCRLVYYEWQGSRSDHPSSKNNDNILPLTVQSWGNLVDSFNLPKSYLHDFVRKLHIPTRSEILERAGRKYFGVVCQSPNLDFDHATMVLSYSHTTNTTYGFLGYESGTLSKSLVPLLKKTARQADNPMLLPSILLGEWCDLLYTEQDLVSSKIRDTVMSRTQVFDEYIGTTGQYEDRKEFEEARNEVIRQYLFLTNSVADFAAGLSAANKTALDELSAYTGSGSGRLKDSIRDLSIFVGHMELQMQSELQHRDRMLGRIEKFLQILESFTGQVIAKETMRDSSAMKSISLLGMIFLPATALATVLSPFLASNSHESRLAVIPAFWVFWYIAIPVTVVVIILWFLWQNRYTIRAWWNRDPG